MSLPAAEVDRAYQFFLGRPPHPENRPDYAGMGDLFRTVIGSAEYRESDRAWKNDMAWPLRQVFVVPEAKVIYCPIGKNGCSFLKGLMIRLSSARDTEFMLRDVHQLTDRVNTGLQLSDYRKGEARAWTRDPAFMKFAVLRDPAERLLSAWVEKFVLNRAEPGNQHHTGAVIAGMQGGKTPDFHRSISFGAFVRYVEAADPARMDPHWRPQHLYLRGIEYTHLFRFDDLNAVVDALEGWTGRDLPRQAVNTTGSGAGGGAQIPRAHELEPPVLDQLPRIAKSCFLDDEMRARIEAVYARDVKLMETIGSKT